ncbi:MAG TPA: hypothetical protein VEV65_14790 [Kineosporiaceae bacterium]|nr:hypothetical protein [Kineosporiaceae bacterium]
MTAGTGRAGDGVGDAAEVERRLLVTLAAWSTWSIGVGGVLWQLGRRERAPHLRSAGRTTVAWGAADAAVVAWGVWRGRSRRDDDPTARARRMARLTGVNAALDVGYAAGGALLAARPSRRGTGLATVVQGLALVYLDTRYCLEFADLARDLGLEGSGRPLESSRARDRRRPARGGGDGPGGNDSVVVRNVS